MSERAIPVTSIIRLGDQVLAQQIIPVTPPWPLIAVTGILLVGIAFWAAAGD